MKTFLRIGTILTGLGTLGALTLLAPQAQAQAPITLTPPVFPDTGSTPGQPNGPLPLTANSYANPTYAPNLVNQQVHFAVLGDSWLQQASTQWDLAVSTGTNTVNGVTIGAGTQPQLSAANIPFLSVLCGQCVYFDPQLDNFGYPGGDLPQILANLPGVVARHPDYVVVQYGHNGWIKAISTTLANGGTSAQAIAAAEAYLVTQEAALATIRTTLVNANIKPIWYLEQSINTDELNDSQAYLQLIRTLTISFNHYKASFAIQNNDLMWDAFSPTINTADATGGLLSGDTEDGIHLSYLGNYNIANQAYTKDLAAILHGPYGGLTASQADAYNSTTNPFGNILPNALFVNTTTSNLPAQVSGTVPQQWVINTLSLGTGKTLTESVNAAANGLGYSWTTAVAGTGTANNNNSEGFFYYQFFTSPFPTTVNVECYVRIIMNNASPFAQVILKTTAGSNQSIGNNWGSTAGATGTNAPGPTGAWSGVIKSPPMTVPVGSSFTIYLQAIYNDTIGPGTFTGTVTFQQPTCNQVPYRKLF